MIAGSLATVGFEGSFLATKPMRVICRNRLLRFGVSAGLGGSIAVSACNGPVGATGVAAFSAAGGITGAAGINTVSAGAASANVSASVSASVLAASCGWPSPAV